VKKKIKPPLAEAAMNEKRKLVCDVHHHTTLDSSCQTASPDFFDIDKLIDQCETEMAEADAADDVDAWVDAFMRWIDLTRERGVVNHG
jgi:hypothetical protein